MSNQVEAAVRRELGRQGRRWAPVAVFGLLVIMVVATARDAPTTIKANGRASLTPAGPGEGGYGNDGVPGGFDDRDGINGTEDATATGVGDPAGGDGVTSTGTGRSRPPGGSAATPARAGVSRTGVTCDGTRRQLPESSYGPLCAPRFTGDNGGSTSHGVTAKEIVVTYRMGESGSTPALEALGGNELDSVGFDQSGIRDDMARLVTYFNTRFELYGRKVKFTPYSGQGDFLEEYQGRGRQGAQADAARAHDLGAFADVSYAGQTQPYAEALASNRVVAYSPIYLSRSWHEARAPYTHSAMWPAGEDGAEFQANVVCGALHPGKAARSNNAAMQAKDRAFGIINAENPEYAKMGDILERRLKGCGAPVVRRVSYPLDVTRAAEIATNVMAQMQSAGATTLLCVCDFLAPRLLMEQGNSQRYYPEWFLTFHWTDPFYRTYPENQFRGQLVGGGVTEPFLTTEPGKVFRAAGGDVPDSPFTFDRAYQQIHLLFTGLQAAGPNLTPETMFIGLQNVPDAPTGALGPAEFGPGPSIPKRWFPLGVYDPDAASNLDGAAGSSIGCKRGTYFRFNNTSAFRDSLGCPL